jgi:hypothetical protein
MSCSIPVPTRNLKLNKYGNMIGGKNSIKRLLNKKDTFQGTTNGIEGIWQRPKKGKRSGGGYGTTGQSGLKLLVAYESTVTYKSRFDFYGIGESSVRKNIGIEIDKAIARAVPSSLV